MLSAAGAQKSFSDINVELGLSPTAQISAQDSSVRKITNTIVSATLDIDSSASKKMYLKADAFPADGFIEAAGNGPYTTPGDGVVAWSGTAFVNVSRANDKQCMSSTDGITWVRKSYWHHRVQVDYNQPNMMVRVKTSSTSQRLWVRGSSFLQETLNDGTTWTPVTTCPVTPLDIQCIASNDIVTIVFGGTIASTVAYVTSDFISWTGYTLPTATPTPTSGILSCIWNGTQFLAIGEAQSCYTSPDGITWTLRTGLYTVVANALPRCVAIGWNGAVYLAAGSAIGWYLATSPDGITWTNRSSGYTFAKGNSPQTIMNIGTRFVFCDTHALFSSTDNAVSWVSVVNFDSTPPVPIKTGHRVDVSNSAATNGVIYLHMLGGTEAYNAGYGYKQLAAAVSSLDGVTWVSANDYRDKASFSPLMSYTLVSTQRGNDKIICASQYGLNLEWSCDSAYSNDGTIWTRGGLRASIVGTFSMPLCLTCNDSIFLAFCSGSGVSQADYSTSTDGATWTNRYLTANASGKKVSGDTPMSVGWDGSKFITLGSGGKVATSPDGVTWTIQNGGVAISPATYINRVFCSNGTTSIFGSNNAGKVYTSTNAGVTWTERTGPSTRGTGAMVWTGTRFLLGDIWGQGGWSTDGITWTALATFSTATGGDAISAAAIGGTTIVFIGQRGHAISSTDNGSNWVDRGVSSKAAFANNYCYGLAYGASKFVGVGLNSACATSTNGITWTAQAGISTALGNSTTMMKSIVWTGTKFVAIGGTTSQVCLTSPDGITWTNQSGLSTAATSAHVYPNQAVWSGTTLLVVGSIGQACTSTDGITWTRQTQLATVLNKTDYYNIQKCVWGNSKFVAIGDAVCNTSVDGLTWTEQNAGISAISTDFSGTSTITGFAFGSGNFVAMTQTGNLAISTDGITWTAITAFASLLLSAYGGVAVGMYGLIYTGSHFIAIGVGFLNHTVCLKSTDGITWENAPNLDTVITSVSPSSAGLFMTVHNGVLILTLNKDNKPVVLASQDNGSSWYDMSRSDLFPTTVLNQAITRAQFSMNNKLTLEINGCGTLYNT